MVKFAYSHESQPFLPNHFIDLHSMLRFHAEHFVTLIRLLGMIQQIAKNSDRETELAARHLALARDHFKDIKSECATLELTYCSLHIDRFLRATENGHLTNGELHTKSDELANRVRDELQSNVFMHLPKEKARFFTESRNIFGQGTLEMFPSIIVEVEEAGKCYAAGRNTAAVFHLMRIMEAGLKCAAAELSIPTETNPSWHSILKKFDEAIQAKHVHDDWTDFYNGLRARLYAVKDAWRNPTMHIDQNYGEEEALDIYNNVTSFMRHLSTRLSEPSSSS